MKSQMLDTYKMTFHSLISKKTIYSTLEAHDTIINPSLEAVLATDNWAREYAQQCIKKAKL